MKNVLFFQRTVGDLTTSSVSYHRVPGVKSHRCILYAPKIPAYVMVYQFFDLGREKLMPLISKQSILSLLKFLH